MFDIYFTKKKDAYIVESRNTKDKFYVKVKPCSGYPRAAKYPYKGTIALIKNERFIYLNMADASSRELYSAIMSALSGFIIRQLDIEQSIRAVEEEQYQLLEQSLEDIDY